MTKSKWFFTTISNICILLFIVYCKPNNQKEFKISVDVYYSATDPKSAEFLKTQLNKVVHSDIAKYLNLKFIPFAGCKMGKGNSSVTKVTCPSGNSEKNANLHHMCAFYHINEVTPQNTKLSFNLNSVLYIICTVKHVTGSFRQLDYKACGNYIKGELKQVENCIRNEDPNLVTEAFRKLNAIKGIAYPAVVFNNKTAEEFTFRSLIPEDTFWDFICKNLDQVIPMECVAKLNSTSAAQHFRISPYITFSLIVLTLQ